MPAATPVVDMIEVFASVPAKSIMDGAGTDANQDLTVYGASGFNVSKTWDAEGYPLERDRVSTFTIGFRRDIPVGDLQRLVWTNRMDKGSRRGLFLTRVRVVAKKAEKAFVLFDRDVNRWLDSKEPTGQTMTIHFKSETGRCEGGRVGP